MKQYTEIKRLRITPEIRHYYDVLTKRYRINTSQFTRQAVIEKLQRDMPQIRKEYEKRSEPEYPF